MICQIAFRRLKPGAVLTTLFGLISFTSIITQANAEEAKHSWCGDHVSTWCIDLKANTELNYWRPASMRAIEYVTQGYNVFSVKLDSEKGADIWESVSLIKAPKIQYKTNFGESIKSDETLISDADSLMEYYRMLAGSIAPLVIDYKNAGVLLGTTYYREESFRSLVDASKNIVYLPFRGEYDYLQSGESLYFETKFQDLRFGIGGYGKNASDLDLGDADFSGLLYPWNWPAAALLATVLSPAFIPILTADDNYIDAGIGYQYSYYQKPMTSEAHKMRGAFDGRFPSEIDSKLYFAKFRHHGIYISSSGRADWKWCFLNLAASYSQGFGSNAIELTKGKFVEFDDDEKYSLTTSNIFYSVEYGLKLSYLYFSILGEIDYKYFYVQKSESWSMSWESMLPFSLGEDGSNFFSRELMLKGMATLGFRY